MVTESTKEGKISYILLEMGQAMLSKDAAEAPDEVIDIENDTRSKRNGVIIDFLELFKKHLLEEISSVKALVGNFSNPAARDNSTR